MKRKLMNLFFIAVLVMMSNVSCVKQEYIDPDTTPIKIIGEPLNDGLVSIKASIPGNYLKSAKLTGDTVYVEKFIPVTYQAISKAGITIASWMWTFAENNAKSSAATVEYWHGLDPGAETTVTLVGVEQNGTAHIASVPVKVIYSLDGMPGMVALSKTPVAGGMFSYVFIAHKKGMKGIKGKYGYVGTITTPSWVVKEIAPADTNFNFVSGAIVAANAGDIGKYVAVRAILAPANQEIHVGHIDPSGNLIWGTFWSFPKNGKFSVDSNGNITGETIIGLPGTSGDDDINAVIRKDILATSVIVYTKHVTAFTKGFVQLQKGDGTWMTPLAESAVTGYSNWGKIEIPYTSFPIPELLVFRFGPNIDTPNVLSTNMQASRYWSDSDGTLQLKVVPVN